MEIAMKRETYIVTGANGRFSHDKATMELGYSPMDPKDSFLDTVRYLRKSCARQTSGYSMWT